MELLFYCGRVPPPEGSGRRNRAFATRFFANTKRNSTKRAQTNGAIPRAKVSTQSAFRYFFIFLFNTCLNEQITFTSPILVQAIVTILSASKWAEFYILKKIAG